MSIWNILSHGDTDLCAPCFHCLVYDAKGIMAPLTLTNVLFFVLSSELDAYENTKFHCFFMSTAQCSNCTGGAPCVRIS